MKFEVGKFYAHDTHEFEYTEGKIEYLYCRSIKNANENYENAKPHFIAELISISGEGISQHVCEDGTPKDSENFYSEISSDEFAKVLLEKTLTGEAHLNKELRRRKTADQERKEKEFECPFKF